MSAIRPHPPGRRQASAALAALGGTLLLGLATGAFPVAALAAPVTVEGQRFDDPIQVAGTPLRLNGAGLRGVLWIKAFAVGLYVPQPSPDVARLLDQPGPRRISLRMLMDIPAEEIVKALRNGLRKNTTPQELAQMDERMNQVAAVLRSLGDRKPGDVLDLDWRQGTGFVISLNGKPRGAAVQGYDLYRGLMKIFIGERAVDKRLRTALLAGGQA